MWNTWELCAIFTISFVNLNIFLIERLLKNGLARLKFIANKTVNKLLHEIQDTQKRSPWVLGLTRILKELFSLKNLCRRNT